MGWFRRLAREDGFTLVELLMVVVIIGILVSIAVASYAMSVSTSKKTACKANLRNIEEQIIVYRTANNENPLTLQDLVPHQIEDEDDLHCPTSGDAYLYDSSTGEVSCPYHIDL